MTEAIIEPDLPIIDPHHHLWDLRPIIPVFPAPRHRFIETLVPAAYYTFDQFNEEVAGSGHNVVGTVFMECGAFYNAVYGDAKKVVGEVEFVNGVAAQSASGLYGTRRLCAGIVGHADLMLGAAVGEVLDALAAACPVSRASAMQAHGMRTPTCLALHLPTRLSVISMRAFAKGSLNSANGE